MKKLLITVVLCCLALTLCSCSKKGPDIQNADALEVLSAEQKRFLKQEVGYPDYALKSMTKEIANFYLLGSGLELYNRTKGVELYGLTYDVDDDFVMPSSTSNRLITLDEATEIRLKEDRIRLEDFLKFKFVSYEEKDNDWRIFLPVDSYKDTYIRLRVTYNDNKLHLTAPNIFYSKAIEVDNGDIFSILYDKADFENFANESNYSQTDRFFGYVKYGTVTDESLIIRVHNTYEKAKKFKTKYKIYEGENTSGKVVCEGKAYSKRKYKIEMRVVDSLTIHFPDKLDKGVYTIDLGDGFVVDTFEVK